jgi:hypothetical protein
MELTAQCSMSSSVRLGLAGDNPEVTAQLAPALASLSEYLQDAGCSLTTVPLSLSTERTPLRPASLAVPDLDLVLTSSLQAGVWTAAGAASPVLVLAQRTQQPPAAMQAHPNATSTGGQAVCLRQAASVRFAGVNSIRDLAGVAGSISFCMSFNDSDSVWWPFVSQHVSSTS